MGNIQTSQTFIRNIYQAYFIYNKHKMTGYVQLRALLSGSHNTSAGGPLSLQMEVYLQEQKGSSRYIEKGNVDSWQRVILQGKNCNGATNSYYKQTSVLRTVKKGLALDGFFGSR